MFNATDTVEVGSEAEVVETHSAVRRRILVVDDKAVVREPISMALRHWGYEVSCATNGREAMDALDHVQPDLILLDMVMPEMDGLTFLRLLRQDRDPARRDLPVIMMTGSGNSDRMREAYRLGVRDYMDKAEVSLPAFSMRVGRCLH